MKTHLLGSALLAAVAMAAPSFASTIAQVTAGGAGTYTITGATVVDVIDQYPAATPTKNTFLLNDGTGGIIAYSEPIATYAAHVGDVIDITAKNSPYQGGAELTSTSYAVSVDSVGSGTSTPLPVTTADLTSGTDAEVSLPVSELYVTLSDVTFPAGTTSLGTKTAYTVTDSSGGTGTIYTYTTYSQVAAAVTAANATPGLLAGPVDITGYVDEYQSGSNPATFEIYPTSIVASASAPEPASLGLLGMGALAMLARRRHNA
jgi:hypothetical protein